MGERTIVEYRLEGEEGKITLSAYALNKAEFIQIRQDLEKLNKGNCSVEYEYIDSDSINASIYFPPEKFREVEQKLLLQGWEW